MEGLKTYFAKYPYKNTELKDFIHEMAQAAVKLGLTETDLTQWADEWLTSAGCSEIGLEVTSENGKITTAKVH